VYKSLDFCTFALLALGAVRERVSDQFLDEENPASMLKRFCHNCIIVTKLNPAHGGLCRN
jgi:hypothetical protein